MTMFLMLAGTTGFAANQVVTTFDGEWTPALPSKNVQEEATYTAPDGTEWIIFDGKLNTYGEAFNLYLAKSSGYIILPKVDFPVGNIVATIGEGSISFTAEISLFIGKEEIFPSERITKVSGEKQTNRSGTNNLYRALLRIKISSSVKSVSKSVATVRFRRKESPRSNP